MAGKSNGEEHKPSLGAQVLSVDELIGRKIHLRRTALNMGLDELAGAVGVMPMELEAFEQGRVRVAPRLLAEIAKVLSVSVAWFFIRSDG